MNRLLSRAISVFVSSAAILVVTHHWLVNLCLPYAEWVKRMVEEAGLDPVYSSGARLATSASADPSPTGRTLTLVGWTVSGLLAAVTVFAVNRWRGASAREAALATVTRTPVTHVSIPVTPVTGNTAASDALNQIVLGQLHADKNRLFDRRDRVPGELTDARRRRETAWAELKTADKIRDDAEAAWNDLVEKVKVLEDESKTVATKLSDVVDEIKKREGKA